MARRWPACIGVGLAVLGLAGVYVTAAGTPQSAAPAATTSPERAFVNQYCVRCHNDRTKAGGLALDTADLENPTTSADVWERALIKLRMRAMPPSGSPRPDSRVYDDLVASLESRLDRSAKANPDPGRTD